MLADISDSLFAPARARHPHRVVNVGIREQLMVSVAGGIAHQDVGAVLVSIGGSYDAAAEGRTHQAPGDERVYVRLSDRSNERAHAPAGGRLALLRRGSGATVVAVGPLLDRVLAATEGLDVTVLYAATVRPFDAETLRSVLAAPDVVLVEPYLAGTSVPRVAAALVDLPYRVLGLGVGRPELRRYGAASDHDAAHGLDVQGLREYRRLRLRFAGHLLALPRVHPDVDAWLDGRRTPTGRTPAVTPADPSPDSPAPSRRQVLSGGAALLAGAAGTLPSGTSYATPRTRPPRTILLETVVVGTGDYAQLPFRVPRGVTRIDVSLRKSVAETKVGVGLFDARGAGYQSPGFRGIYGEERSRFFVARDAASQSFMPGPMSAGRWMVLVPVFRAPVPTQVTVTVRMSFAEPGERFRPGPEPGVVSSAPGWYRGDFHCHTPASSDAWASGSALRPAEWAATCRRIGLDFVALTDHNVVTQNYFLARDAGADVLLLAGEEMTNWFHGHATVSGISPGDWLDFRQSPYGLPLPTGGARIAEFIRVAEQMGGYVSAAHPFGATLAWQFFGDAEVDPAARTHGMEVWTGPWQPDEEVGLRYWDLALQRGWRLVGNGGSDLHGADNTSGFAAGLPTTVLHASRLAKRDVIAAARAGRAFVTKAPDGVEVYLTARRPGQRTYTGGTVYADVGDPVRVRCRVRRGAGRRLLLVAQGLPVSVTPLDSDDQTVQATLPVPPGGGYVRAEVRGEPTVDLGDVVASSGDMEALTNPIWLAVGDPPAGYVAEDAPVPEHAGPRRTAGAS